MSNKAKKLTHNAAYTAVWTAVTHTNINEIWIATMSVTSDATSVITDNTIWDALTQALEDND